MLSWACGSSPAPSGPTQGSGTTDTRVRVLMLTATAGFRHDSISSATNAIRALSASTGEFTVTVTEDLRVFSPGTLANYDVIMFALTSGELPLSADQQAALVAFVSGGRGFIGIHSATDTLYGWSEYERLVGAYFREHPWVQRADVIVES